MKSFQRYQQIITTNKQNKLITNKKEKVSPVNNNQNKEITKTMKPSISSNNCTIQKNVVHITPIKRNNSNTKITITHSNIPNISEALNDNKNNINKRKYIVTIIDRKQNFLENKNNLNQRHPSFSKIPQIQEKIENKTRDKSFDLGQSHSQTKINININKYNTKIINNYKINKIPISNVFNNIDYTKKNTDRRNICNPINNSNNQNDQERLSTEPRNNIALYISGSSNINFESKNKNKKEEIPKSQIPIQHKRIYSMKTGSREDLVENNLLRINYQKPNEKKNEQKSIYNNYITFTSKYNKNNTNKEENKLRKSFDNSNITNDNSAITDNNKNRNHYIYESKNIAKEERPSYGNDKNKYKATNLNNNTKNQYSNITSKISGDNNRNKYS